MFVFDGTTAAPVITWRAWDAIVDGNYLYALDTSNAILRTADLISWEPVALAPEGARSIGILNGRLYVGGQEAEMYRFAARCEQPA